MPPARQGCRARHTTLAAALALVALAVPFAGTASAQPAATRVVATGHGITAPGGVVVTPDNRVWISDEALGLCRVTASGPEQDEFCAPEPPEPPDPAPGEPEPTPEPPTRPSGTGQIAFDGAGCSMLMSPLDAADLTKCNFYVAEGTSAGSGIWRMHWNMLTGRIDAATKIFDSGPADRVFALALTDDGDVLFSSKLAPGAAIRRIAHPATITQPSEAAPSNSGFAFTAGEASSLAVLGDDVYLAEGGALTRFSLSSGGAVATPVAGQPAGASINALAADRARGVVFAGTANEADLTDAVLSLDGGQFSVAAYDRSYTFITGMGVAPDGSLYVAHDANAGLSPGVDTPGNAELWRKDRGPLVAPDVSLTGHPKAVTTGDTDVAFAFDAVNGTEDTHFSCTLDGAPVSCAKAGTAQSGEYAQPAGEPLGEGSHTFTVRATNVPDAEPSDWGPLVTYAFRIDRTPPVLTIDAPSSHTAVGGRLTLYFSASEAGVAFTCAVDGGAATGCNPPRAFTLAQGQHTITVRATDDAGNPSGAVTWDVTAVPAPVDPDPPVSTPGVPVKPPAPAAPAGQAVAGVSARSVSVASTARAPRIEIDVPCVEVSPARAAARFRLSGRNAVVRFRAPAKARYAKFTLRRASGGRRAARIVETVGYAKVARAGAAHTTRVLLTRSQRAQLRRGRQRLAVAYGTCRTQVGQWTWVRTSTTKKGARR